MEFKDVIKDESQDIINALKKEGYANKIIAYSEFLRIYSKYSNLMSDLEFAYLLGLNYDKFRAMRTKGTRSMILVQEASLELQNEIIDKLKREGYTNRLITYQEFLELYKEYEKEITKQEFAKIIGITPTRYQNFKNRGGKTRILVIEVDEKKIFTEVNNKYGSILVDYQKFLCIYDEYKKILNNERKFAEIIGVTSDSYSSMKNNGTKAMIVKDSGVSCDKSEAIVREVLAKGLANKLITYQEFLEIYKDYESFLSELQFAKILKISSLKYRNMKYYDCKTYVLGKDEKLISNKRKEEIIEEIINEGYANKGVTYLEFKKIYERYENEIDEKEFAELLDISYQNWSTIRVKGSRAIILKKHAIPPEIIEKISCDKRIKEAVGQMLDYNYFDSLYRPYEKYVTKKNFAKMIGISEPNFENIKRFRVKVDRLLAEKMRIKYLFRESRIYTYAEVSDFCDKYKCSINNFFKTILQTDNEDIINEYLEVIKKGSVFLGSCPIEKEIVNKYSTELIKFIDTKSKSLGSFYQKNLYCDDVTSDTLLYLMQKRGDLFINFSEDKAFQKIKYFAIKYMKCLYLSYLNSKENSLDKMDEKLGDRNHYLSDKSANTENDAIDNMPLENCDDVICFYEQCYEEGFSISEILDEIALKMQIEKDEVIELLKESLLEKREIKQTKCGEYYLGRKFTSG